MVSLAPLFVQLANLVSWACPTRRDGELLANRASWRCSKSPRWRVALVLGPTRQSGELEVLQLAGMASWSCLKSNSPIGRVGVEGAPTRRDGELILLSVQLAILASRFPSSVEFVANGSSSQFNDAVPKVEFEITSVDPEDEAAYWEACGELKPARAGLWTPPPFIPNHEADCPRKSCSNVGTPNPPFPEDLPAIRKLFLEEKCHWADFTPKRVPHALALYHSRFEPGMSVDEESGSNMHGFVPHEGRKKKGKASTRKGKRTSVDHASIDLDDFFDFKLPSVEGSSTEVPEFAEASRSVNEALLKVRRALGTSRQEARMAHFRTDMAEKEIARLKSELDNRREGEPCEADVRRAYRRGRRDVAKIVRTRRERFSHEFGELQANHKALGLPRVSWHCGGLYLTTAHDYSYDIERRLPCPFENEPGVSGSGQESKLTMRPERVCDGVDPFSE
ncbi:hypothetical protein Bca101_043884 [Brassica carinata]